MINMDQESRQDQQTEPCAPSRKIRPALRFAVGVLVVAGALFGSAGRFDWVGGWILLIVYPLSMGLLYPSVRRHPGLVEERTQGWKKAKPWDRGFLVLFGIACPVATILVAGLDLRFGWSATLDAAAQVLGCAMLVAGIGLGGRALASNPFYSSVIRIQTDRGHVVATGGPYAYVRHPGYSGAILSSMGTPLLLGSAWALVPGLVGVVGIVARTAIEDRILQGELPGYQDYAHRVGFRLMPGVW
jgi:protein-S-isoprenylcysteine O-methyltransferase Ste14